MWTHLTPYLEQEQTGASIARNSRIALYRAMNLRRLIAMTGSGATVPFGLPDWADLAVLFAEATQTQIDRCLECDGNFYAASEIRRRIVPLTRQINSLCEVPDAAEPSGIRITRAQLRALADVTMVMDLCEKLSEAFAG